MSRTLYLLRQQPEHISPALFRVSDVENEVVLTNQLVPRICASVKGTAVNSEKMLVTDSAGTVTYDELIEKIFSSSHVIVI